MKIACPCRYFRLLLPVVWVSSFAAATATVAEVRRFDFGEGSAAAGYEKIKPDSLYDAATGFGWTEVQGRLEVRDRALPEAPLRDFVFGRGPAVFRVDLPLGIYRVEVGMADRSYGDHVLQVSLNAGQLDLPPIQPQVSEQVTLSLAFEVTGDHLELRFSSPVENWIVNSITLEPADEPLPVSVERRRIALEMVDLWEDIAAAPFPGQPLLETFRENLQQMPQVEKTNLRAADYLRVIAGNVDFFRERQDERGAIIDPYRNEEYQYSTPCYALAGAVLVEHEGRLDLLPSVALAMDWAVRSLARREAATAHEDFYAPVLAHALPILAKHVEPERVKAWRDQLAGIDPWAVYRDTAAGGNWNLVAASGEGLFHLLGLREDTSFVELSMGRQGRVFRSPWGLYLEGPMAYDHFPRLWLADLLAAGYDGEFRERLDEVLRRAALTSLFIQSPTGELPTGGRSAHHQWNEAQQAVTFEIYARYFAEREDEELAGVFKRAARLALSSMLRWQRASGELWIVKNRVDPARAHAYEGYSSHSQYNLLAAAMLAIAHGHAQATEALSEQWTPSEVGGFVVDLRPGLPHLIANARGTYVQINTAPDPFFNAAGLMRIHQRGFNPQLGPSDGPVVHAAYRRPAGPRTTASVGVAWQDGSGTWHRLAEQPRERIRKVELSQVERQPAEVRFRLEWHGDFPGAGRVVEEYRLTAEGVQLTVEVPGATGALRWVLPLLADDGERQSGIDVTDDRIHVQFEGETRLFSFAGAAAVWVEEDHYAYHNGWARLGFAEFPGGGKIGLEASSRRAE
jgi:hypothetical protein